MSTAASLSRLVPSSQWTKGRPRDHSVTSASGLAVLTIASGPLRLTSRSTSPTFQGGKRARPALAISTVEPLGQRQPLSGPEVSLSFFNFFAPVRLGGAPQPNRSPQKGTSGLNKGAVDG